MRIGEGLLLLAMVAASPEIRYFRYERPVVSASRQGGQTCMVLDAGVFAHGAPQLADLRIYHDGTETPYVIRTASPEEGAEKSIMPLNLGAQGGQTVFDAELPDTHYSDLHLDLTAQNFIATVTVTGRRTKGASAETKLGAYTIFDLTRQKLGRSTVLHLPASDFPFLHFRVAGPVAPEDVKELSVERLPASQPGYVTIAASAQVTQKGHSSIVEFTVPAHVPVDRVAFTPGASPALFSRDVNISVAAVPSAPATDGAERAQPVVARGDLLRVHSNQNGHRIDEERLAMDAPVVDFDVPAQWTISVDNGDDAPLMFSSVRLEMLERTLCFEAAANTSYALYYGDKALMSPRYDYATLFVAQANALPATEGAETLNSVYEPRPDERPFTERHPALLWVALVGAIVLLGTIALRSAKRAG